MTHDILFRGKRADDGKWIESSSIKQISSDEIFLLGGRCWIKIVPSTVGQFAGLTGKNGRKIFEGDILDLSYYMIKYVGVVKFGEYKDFDMTDDYTCGHVGFYIEIEERYHKRYYVRRDILFFVSECKVLGNIHDNPELLKGDPNV